MTKTQTDKQRISQLEKEVAELKKELKEVRELANFNLFDFSKTQGEVSVHSTWIKEMRERLGELEREENLLPPTLSEEEERLNEERERYWRIGI